MIDAQNIIHRKTNVGLTSSELLLLLLLTSSPPRVTVSRVVTVFFPSGPIFVSVTTHRVTDLCVDSIMGAGGSKELHEKSRNVTNNSTMIPTAMRKYSKLLLRMFCTVIADQTSHRNV